MSQLLIEYSIRFKIVFVLALDFYVYIQLDDDESTKWLGDSIYRKKLLYEIDLNDISDDFVSQNVRRYF
jgi:hypothetical protein